jgi:hypothetical protein
VNQAGQDKRKKVDAETKLSRVFDQVEEGHLGGAVGRGTALRDWKVAGCIPCGINGNFSIN